MAISIDFAADLQELARLASDPNELDRMMAHALDSLGRIVHYDLASVLELKEGTLHVRVARGKLASAQVKQHHMSLAEFPSVKRILDDGKPVAVLEHDHATEGDLYDGVLNLENGHSCMVVPLSLGDRVLGAMTFDRTVCEPYPTGTVQLAGVYGQLVALALQLADQTRLLDRVRHNLVEQNKLLQVDTGRTQATERLDAARSAAMQALSQAARQVATADVPVLIQGETGVGKEVVAQAIHDWSPRREHAFVKLNCAALPENLVESELFGHVKGAFSGATANRQGRFVTANGGTLLLDEVGELALPVQAKLLRVLQEGTFEPVGSDRTVRVDVRILAATHVDLRQAVADRSFREDLYYRLAVFPLRVPALRERVDDLPVLAEDILGVMARRTGRGPWWLGPEAMGRLREHGWPGNVRELVNLLERATILEGQGQLTLRSAMVPHEPAGDVGQSRAATGGSTETVLTLQEVQKRHIERVLTQTHGRIYGPGGAGDLLGIKPSTLQSRMKKLGVVKPSRNAAK